MEGDTMSTHPHIAHLPRDERIRLIAYAIWEEEGRPEGRAEEHWYKACELVDAEAVMTAPAAETPDPDWLVRAAAEAAAEQASAAASETGPSSLEDVVRRIATTRAA
jgi:hypothetical protein